MPSKPQTHYEAFQDLAKAWAQFWQVVKEKSPTMYYIMATLLFMMTLRRPPKIEAADD